MVADGRARTDDLVLHSEDLDLEGKGWLGLDATVDMEVAARFSPEASRGMIEKNARIRSFTDREGRLTIHLHVKGDLASPVFRLDTSRQVDTLKEHQKKRLEDELKGRLIDLLGGQREEDRP